MAAAIDPNHGFLIKPRRKTLLGPNSKKVPVAIAMTERAGSAGRTAPAHYAHFQPAILTGFGMTKRQHCRSKDQKVKSSLKRIGENCGLTADAKRRGRTISPAYSTKTTIANKLVAL